MPWVYGLLFTMVEEVECPCLAVQDQALCMQRREVWPGGGTRSSLVVASCRDRDGQPASADAGLFPSTLVFNADTGRNAQSSSLSPVSFLEGPWNN